MSLQPSQHVRRLALLAVVVGAAVIAVLVGVVSAVSPSRVVANARASAAAGLTTASAPVATASSALAAQSSVLASESPWMASFGALETGTGGLPAAQVAASRVAQSANAAKTEVAGLSASSWQAAGVRGLEAALSTVATIAGQAASAPTVGAYDADAQSLMGAFDTLAATSEHSLAVAGTP